MASLNNPGVISLLTEPNYAVASTVNEDGSILSVVVWVNLEDGKVAVNSEVSRRWPANLKRDPRMTVMVYHRDNPFEYVEVEGTVTATTEGADGHIDRLAKKYINEDSYPFHQPGDQRISFVLDEHVVRYSPPRS
jgi:PPOX class probable F420-dependent enzyme